MKPVKPLGHSQKVILEHLADFKVSIIPRTAQEIGDALYATTSEWGKDPRMTSYNRRRWASRVLLGLVRLGRVTRYTEQLPSKYEALKYGFYNDAQVHDYGTHIYLNPDGEEVEVTTVARCPDGGIFAKKGLPLGVVTRWIRRGQQGHSPDQPYTLKSRR